MTNTVYRELILKAMKKLIFILSLLVIIVTSCEKIQTKSGSAGDKTRADSTATTDSTDTTIPGDSVSNTDTSQHEIVKWWILVHPNSPNGTPGIYLYNETTMEEEKRLDLPDSLYSPHALDYDGNSLWLGGYDTLTSSIYELNPDDGTIRSKIRNISTEGIASVNDELFYSGNSRVFEIKKDGTPVDTFLLPTNVIQDIAVKDNELYYVVNGSTDPIIQFDMQTEQADTVLETNVLMLYTLCIRNNNFVVVDDNNEIRRFDRITGQKISDTKTTIDGWITAIAPDF